MYIILCLLACFSIRLASADSYIDWMLKVPCNASYLPENCGYPSTKLEDIVTVEDLDRCGPAALPVHIRNYYWLGSGRKLTYVNNFAGLKRTRIAQRVLRDVSRNTIRTTVLGSTLELPVGISPTAAQKMAHPDGELATARAAAAHGTVMTLSSYSQTRLEDVANAAFSVNNNSILWMQTYIFKNRSETLQIVRRAEKSRFKAIVVTIDSPVHAKDTCSSGYIVGYTALNLVDEEPDANMFDASLTVKDLEWLIRSTKLPVVAKGVTTGEDALMVAKAGVSAIFVSNQGGRQLDSVKPSIESLREVVNAVHKHYPNIEIYMDGAVRNGWDVFKVLAAGARAAFIGRPVIWGLAIAGEDGVSKALTILKKEFNETMITAGYSSPREIYNDSDTDSKNDGITTSSTEQLV